MNRTVISCIATGVATLAASYCIFQPTVSLRADDVSPSAGLNGFKITQMHLVGPGGKTVAEIPSSAETR